MFIVKYQPKFLSFNEWLKQNPDVLDQEENCTDCDGEGTIECMRCGHEEMCEKCGGSGTKNNPKDLYKQQRERDKELWEKGLVPNGNL